MEPDDKQALPGKVRDRKETYRINKKTPARIATRCMPFPLTVTATDQFGNSVDSYRGTVSLMTSDPVAVLPPDYTYTAADAGAHTFTVALVCLGLGRLPK